MPVDTITLDIEGRWVRTTPTPGPLALLLPGTGATALWADTETGWLAGASAAGFRGAVAEGTLPDPARPHRFRDNPLRFNDAGPWPTPHTVDDVGFLTAVIDQLGDGRACVAGFSNGAGMAFRLTAERADRVTALVAVAGLCWVAEPRPVRAVPTLYVIGTVDPMVPPSGGTVALPWGQTVTKPPVSDTLERWAAGMGLTRPEMSAEPQVWTDRDGVRMLTAHFVDGLGHHWPGGHGGMNPRLFGPTAPPTSDRFDATTRILEFFRSVLGG